MLSLGDILVEDQNLDFGTPTEFIYFGQDELSFSLNRYPVQFFLPEKAAPDRTNEEFLKRD